MKQITLILILLSTIVRSNGQTLSEWFDQKATQLKYLAEQIGAYEGYVKYLEKGYDVAEKGLHLIDDIKTGEFNLHEAFYTALATVNPLLSKSSNVERIVKLVSEITNLAIQFGNYHSLTKEEMQYAETVRDHLIKNCLEAAGELVTMISNQQLSMDDGTRLERIDKIISVIDEQHGFAYDFNRKLAALNNTRNWERNDLNSSSILQGLK